MSSTKAKKQTQRSITLGALEPSLNKQLDGLVREDTAKYLEAMAQAINLLTIRNILSSSESLKTKKRLMKLIQKEVLQYDFKS